MLTQLSTVKNRLAISDTDTQYDALLTRTLQAISARFDAECRRTLARTENFIQEFAADDAELSLACYPLESVARFELSLDAAAGWAEQPGVGYQVRLGCVLSLSTPLWASRSRQCLGRIVYTGGYVLPGTTPQPGQTALPPELEQAAIEQAAFWFQRRNELGVIRQWPKGGTYLQFSDLDLLPSVPPVLEKYRRWML